MVRFGNLDRELRLPFWQKLCPYEDLQQALREELNLNENVSVYEEVLKIRIDKLPVKVKDEISRDLKRTNTSERLKGIEG